MAVIKTKFCVDFDAKSKRKRALIRSGLLLIPSGIFLINTSVEAAEGDEQYQRGNYAYDFNNEFTFNPETEVNFGTGIIRSRGRVISRTKNVKLGEGRTMVIERGGVFENHAKLALYKGSRIVGEGKVINYTGFQDDEANNELVESNKEDGGYKVDEYDSQRDLTENEDIEKATYFDLVNDEDLQINKFKVYAGEGKIYSTTKLGHEATPDDNPDDFIEVTTTDQGTADHGQIASSITFEKGGFNQAETELGTAYDLGSVKDERAGACEFIHSSDVKDDVKGSLFSLHGFDTEDSEGATQFKFGDGDEKKDVYIPKVDDELVLGKTMPDTDNAMQYEQDIMDKLATTPENNSGLFAYTDWDESDPVTTYHGSNSWFNGVYKLKRGAMIVPNTADMFGGRVELGNADEYDGPSGSGLLALHKDLVDGKEEAKEFIKQVLPTEFEWQGGSKDEFNKPQIYMNGNSTLYFYIPEDDNGNRIFSFYGNITGTERDRMIFEQGEVRIKGDCSGFKGSVAVVQGAKFEVRKSDDTSSSTYVGKFPNANIYQIDSSGRYVNGGDGAVTEIDTANMENVTINNGNMELKNTGTENDGKITLKSASIGGNALTTLTGEAEIKDTTIRGVVVANGNLRAENTILHGGVLAIQGNLVTNNFEAGSTVAVWGNENYGDKVTVGDAGGAGVFEITEEHTLKIFSDYSVTEKNADGTYKADTINAQNASHVKKGGGIAIAGMNFNEMPTGNEYRYKVYSGTPADMPITIGGTYGTEEVFDLFVGGKFTATSGGTDIDKAVGGIGEATDKKYTYTVEKGDKVSTMKEDGIYFAEFNNGNIYKIVPDGLGGVLLVKSLSNAALSADTAQDAAIASSVMGIGEIAMDSDALIDSELFANDDSGALSSGKVKPGKYGLWNKTFGEHSTIDLKGTDDVKTNGAGTMVGFDWETQTFSGTNTRWIPTVFAGLQHQTFKYKGTKYKSDGYFGGVKFAMFNKTHLLEAFGMYELFKNHGTVKDTKIKMKSHIFNIGAKYEYNFDMKQNYYLRPHMSFNYAFVQNPSFTGYNNARHKLNNRHMFEVSPGISLVKRINTWTGRAFMTYHQKFGTKGKTTSNGFTEKTNFAKKQHLEYGLEVNKINQADTANIGFKLSRKTLGVKGFKATVSLGIKF